MTAVTLTHGKVANIDDQDYALVSVYQWSAIASRRGYRVLWYAIAASGTKGGPPIYMHRLIMEPPRGTWIDHIDDDGLNNQRRNLRVCSRSQNLARVRKRIFYRGRPTSSRYRGVNYQAQYDSWRSYIQGEHIGTFCSEDEAAVAYNVEALRRFGEYARLNPVPNIGA